MEKTEQFVSVEKLIKAFGIPETVKILEEQGKEPVESVVADLDAERILDLCVQKANAIVSELNKQISELTKENEELKNKIVKEFLTKE